MDNDAQILDYYPLYRDFTVPVSCAQRAEAGNDGQVYYTGERVLPARDCVFATIWRVLDAKGAALCNDGL